MERPKSTRMHHHNILILLMVLASSFSFIHASISEPTKIGVVLPLTGDAAFWGTNGRNGALLALEDLNKNGKKFELIFEDSQCDPKTAVTAFQRLTKTRGIKYVVGDICSSCTLAMAPLAEKTKVVLVTPCSAAPQISNAGEFVFRTWSPMTVETKMSAKYAYETMKLRKIAILYVEIDFGEAARSDFRGEFERLGGTIVYEEAHSPSEVDLRSQLTRVRTSGADGIFLASHIADGIVAVKQAREIGLTIPIIGTTGINSADFIKPLGQMSDGIVFGEQKDMVTADYKKRFSDAYRVEWPGHGSCAAVAYDALSLIAAAVDSVGEDTEKVRTWLDEVPDFKGVSGPITFDKNGDVYRAPQMFKIASGAIVPIE